MEYEIIDVTEKIISDLSDRWLDDNGRIRLLPAAEFQSVPPEHLRGWCHRTARYGIPTVELVDWLKERIAGKRAIEIGSGNGDLGYHLGIPESDSYSQQLPEVNCYLRLLGQIPTDPRPEVKRYDAEAAVKKVRPDVVIGSWITRKFIIGKDIEGVSEANVYGPIEEHILKGCREYIHIGNWKVHKGKTLLTKPYEAFTFPWLVSRGTSPEMNVIMVWRNNQLR